MNVQERLFIALTLAAPVRDALGALIHPMRGVVWTRPEQLHLTLRFLGTISVEQIEPIQHRLATIRVASFILPIEGLGSFPPNHPPRIIWVGVGMGHPRLYQLRQRLDDALLATGLTIDVRKFHPHATLARCDETAAPAVSNWLRAHASFAAPPYRVESFGLYSSKLLPTGAIHSLVRQFQLTA